MIIRDQGIVIGKLDEKTLQLTDSTSARLTKLVEDWRKNGIDTLQAAEEPLEEGQGCSGCVSINVPFEPESINFFRTQLLIAGFEVQPA